MSQRSRVRNSQRSTNLSQSHNSTKTELSQPQSQSQSVFNELVEKCVRYFLIKMGTNIPIKRAQIIQHVFKEKPGKSFEPVIKQASDILQNIYGLKLCTIDAETNNKKYVITSELEHLYLLRESADEDLKVTVTFLVLTHIFMSKDSATETSLWEFLKGVNILPEKKIVGSTVHSFVTKQLVKEQYIQFETVGNANDDGEIKKKFSWGSRAERCVSKMKILEFVGKMYGNVNIMTWTSRYEQAAKQFGEVENMVQED